MRLGNQDLCSFYGIGSDSDHDGYTNSFNFPIEIRL